MNQGVETKKNLDDVLNLLFGEALVKGILFKDYFKMARDNEFKLSGRYSKDYNLVFFLKANQEYWGQKWESRGIFPGNSIKPLFRGLDNDKKMQIIIENIDRVVVRAFQKKDKTVFFRYYLKKIKRG